MFTIGLCYDLRSDYLAAGLSEEEVAEFDQDDTIDAHEATLQSLGYATNRIGNVRELARRLVAGERWDLVFNVAEGLWGRSREAQVPCLLEAYGVPYVFSDPLVCAVTLDKAVAKRLVRSHGLATPDFTVVRHRDEVDLVDLPYPLFAKPLAEGTGRGISAASRVESRDDLRTVCHELLATVREPVLVETYLPGREFTTGLVGTGINARVIGTMEVDIYAVEGNRIYSHDVKENWRRMASYGPVADVELLRDIEDLALRSYRALECRDGGRVDIRLDGEGRPAFMEVNPLPGLNPVHSDLPMLARQNGVEFQDLMRMIVDSALERLNDMPDVLRRLQPGRPTIAAVA